MKTILIADDNVQIINVLRQYAIKEGFEVYTAEDGEQAIREFSRRKLDAIILDVMMPKKDGFAVCREIRQSSMVPIIMVTARSEDYDRIMGLDIGADDYVVKPFSPSEVMARLRAVLRRIRVEETKTEQLQRQNLKIDLDTFEVYIGGSEATLTKKEVEILWLLASNPGRVFSRNQILDMVWGYDYFGDNRTVDTHIKRLRAKLNHYDHKEWEIATVRGMGYKFEVQNG